MKTLKLKTGLKPTGEQFVLPTGQRTEHRMLLIQEGADEIVQKLNRYVDSINDDRDQFTGMVVELIRMHRPEWDYSIPAPLLVEITTSDGVHPLNLRNIFAACRAAPDDELSILQRVVNSVVNSDAPGEPVQLPQVLPVFRHTNRSQTGEFAVPVNDELRLMYAVDTEDAIGFPMRDISVELGLTTGELYTASVNNLANRFRKVSFERLGDGVSRLIGDGSYDTSLVLVRGLWNKMAHGVKGEFIYGLPRRETLLYCDSADGKAVRHLRELTKWHFVQGPYRISDKLFVWQNGKLEIFSNR